MMWPARFQRSNMEVFCDNRLYSNHDQVQLEVLNVLIHTLLRDRLRSLFVSFSDLSTSVSERLLAPKCKDVGRWLSIFSVDR